MAPLHDSIHHHAHERIRSNRLASAVASGPQEVRDARRAGPGILTTRPAARMAYPQGQGSYIWVLVNAGPTTRLVSFRNPKLKTRLLGEDNLVRSWRQPHDSSHRQESVGFRFLTVVRTRANKSAHMRLQYGKCAHSSHHCACLAKGKHTCTKSTRSVLHASLLGVPAAPAQHCAHGCQMVGAPAHVRPPSTAPPTHTHTHMHAKG